MYLCNIKIIHNAEFVMHNDECRMHNKPADAAEHYIYKYKQKNGPGLTETPPLSIRDFLLLLFSASVLHKSC